MSVARKETENRDKEFLRAIFDAHSPAHNSDPTAPPDASSAKQQLRPHPQKELPPRPIRPTTSAPQSRPGGYRDRNASVSEECIGVDVRTQKACLLSRLKGERAMICGAEIVTES